MDAVRAGRGRGLDLLAEHRQWLQPFREAGVDGDGDIDFGDMPIHGSRMLENGGTPEEIVEAKGLAQVSDSVKLDTWCQAAINANPGPADDVRNGKENAINFLKGQVMKASRGKANPQVVGETLAKLLKS